MADDIIFGIILSIFMGLILFSMIFIAVIIHFTALSSVLIIFSILNYWMRINIKEFVKSYFLTFFIIFLITIIIGFYITYGVDNVGHFVLVDPPEVEKLSPQEYKAYNYFKFLTFITMFFFINTFIMFLCLLQAYFFKCYSTGVKRKKISWLIGFVCNVFILIASAYTVRFGLF
ncbi:hypothetical protein [Campylobacter taeniopygiae]|uniref:Uncharacterized protein n=1 Tax=Campylobacter taeniopygiae TaxID=2510188 RepID=A0ABY2TGL0_9BACT|nr:hypothetical protein [Campylobacter taeniopygiae]TKX33256.1 hypothetical protein CQA75_08500 [Campylobacter taeniopygiae]